MRISSGFAGFFILPASSFAGPSRRDATGKQGKGITVYTRPVQARSLWPSWVSRTWRHRWRWWSRFRITNRFPRGTPCAMRSASSRTSPGTTRSSTSLHADAGAGQDMVVDTVFEVNRGGKAILMNALQGPDRSCPEQVREMTHLVGKYTLTKVNDSTTHVVYVVDLIPPDTSRLAHEQARKGPAVRYPQRAQGDGEKDVLREGRVEEEGLIRRSVPTHGREHSRRLGPSLQSSKTDTDEGDTKRSHGKLQARARNRFCPRCGSEGFGFRPVNPFHAGNADSSSI